MDPGQDLPITGVCVVSDPRSCPPNYTLIDKTYDRPEDADLWKDGIFTRRVMRYLCVERQIPMQTQDVLVDVTLINERDPTPPGFTVIDSTHDTREKATKKKCICVRWMVPSMTTDAISELVLLTRAQRRAPIGYTLVGELNNMSLAYKMGRIPQTGSTNPQSLPASEAQGYAASPLNYNMGPMPSSLPYAMIPVGQGAPATGDQASPGSAGCVSEAQVSDKIHATSGVEWKMNPKYCMLLEMQDLTIADIQGKTLAEINRLYEYDFSTERAVSKAQAMT